MRVLQALTDGAHIAEIVDGSRAATTWCCACPTSAQPAGPGAHADRHAAGRMPVSARHGGGERRPEPDRPRERPPAHRVYANTDGRDMSGDRRSAAIAETPLPTGYFISLEGQFQAQEQATRLIALLSLVSLAMIFLVLYSRYRSAVLAGIIMANIPLALIGSVVGDVDRG
jgi:HME family heavy-metal exporter